MIFHSLDFVAFLLVTTLVYWRLPQRGQNALLLAGELLLLRLRASMVSDADRRGEIVDYWAARGMEAAAGTAGGCSSASASS